MRVTLLDLHLKSGLRVHSQRRTRRRSTASARMTPSRVSGASLRGLNTPILGKLRPAPIRRNRKRRFGTARRSLSASLISPAFTSRAFSFAIRFSNSDAGSSFGSCGTSLPRTARSRTKRRSRAIASGASAIAHNARAGVRHSSGQRLGEDRLQLVAQARRLGLGWRKIGQQRFRVAVVVGHACGFLMSRL